MIGYHPTEAKILCTAEREADKSAGGIIIPDNAKAPLTQGVVIEAGSMCDQDLYCPGRIVIFMLHTESRVQVGKDMFIVVDPVNVLLTGPVLAPKSNN